MKNVEQCVLSRIFSIKINFNSSPLYRRFQKQAVLTSSPVQPRFTAQPITAPSVQQPSSSTETLRPQQAPPSVVNQRPLTSLPTNKEDQNDSADIVDAFALIDEALLETDDLV